MAFIRQQERKDSAYHVLVESYRDEEGSVRQRTKYLGAEGSPLAQHQECEKCGEEDLCWSSRCADCLAEEVWNKGEDVPKLKGPNKHRFEVHENEQGKADYMMVELKSGGEEKEIKEIRYFDYVVEKEDYIHLYKKWSRSGTLSKEGYPDYLIQLLRKLKRDDI